jgi:hypothetical protein
MMMIQQQLKAFLDEYNFNENNTCRQFFTLLLKFHLL